MTGSRARARPSYHAAGPTSAGQGQARDRGRPAFAKPANDNRMPARKYLALWALPLTVLALAGAIIWRFL